MPRTSGSTTAAPWVWEMGSGVLRTFTACVWICAWRPSWTQFCARVLQATSAMSVVSWGPLGKTEAPSGVWRDDPNSEGVGQASRKWLHKAQIRRHRFPQRAEFCGSQGAAGERRPRRMRMRLASRQRRWPAVFGRPPPPPSASHDAGEPEHPLSTTSFAHGGAFLMGGPPESKACARTSACVCTHGGSAVRVLCVGLSARSTPGSPHIDLKRAPDRFNIDPKAPPARRPTTPRAASHGAPRRALRSLAGGASLLLAGPRGALRSLARPRGTSKHFVELCGTSLRGSRNAASRSLTALCRAGRGQAKPGAQIGARSDPDRPQTHPDRPQTRSAFERSR